jgi:hypothetical protein
MINIAWKHWTALLVMPSSNANTALLLHGQKAVSTTNKCFLLWCSCTSVPHASGCQSFLCSAIAWVLRRLKFLVLRAMHPLCFCICYVQGGAAFNWQNTSYGKTCWIGAIVGTGCAIICIVVFLPLIKRKVARDLEADRAA